jgi:hypothetical protein
MIFIFSEDRTLQVVDSLDEVRRNCEGIDVENRVFQFFDQNGSRLEPRFTKPNKTSRVFGVFSMVESGEYELIPSPVFNDREIFLSLLEGTVPEANPWFKNLDDVKDYLETRPELSSDEGSS